MTVDSNEVLKQMVGLVFTHFEGEVGDSMVTFRADLDQRRFDMYHTQDCCESVYLAEICGDPNDLLMTPLLHAEEVVEDHEPLRNETATWTFYHLRTIKGSVTLRWVGESNGYYSERVDVREVDYK